jgi:hypothetical protein
MTTTPLPLPPLHDDNHNDGDLPPSMPPPPAAHARETPHGGSSNGVASVEAKVCVWNVSFLRVGIKFVALGNACVFVVGTRFGAPSTGNQKCIDRLHNYFTFSNCGVCRWESELKYTAIC